MMLKSFSEKRIRFAPIRNTLHGPSSNEVRQYRVRVEIGLMTILSCLIILFVISKRLPEKSIRLPELSDHISILIDEIPITRQGRPKTAPSRPVIPIPDESEILPDDITIEPEQFALDAGVPLLGNGGFGDFGEGGSGFMPRPIREAVPEFPEADRKKGIHGVVELSILVNARGRVDSVRVIQNTTGSKRLAQAAKNAAYRSLYRPPSGKLKGQSCWITRPYRFESD
ncbi:energy transducer TonB [candidate division KSB1 bacterium]|nr:energy transducer TonB [candidate division KSB1 bacterium]